jgi:hypothetical protein
MALYPRLIINRKLSFLGVCLYIPLVDHWDQSSHAWASILIQSDNHMFDTPLIGLWCHGSTLNIQS